MTPLKPIESSAEYEAAIKEIGLLWGGPLGTPEGDRLDELATLVEMYEKVAFPL